MSDVKRHVRGPELYVKCKVESATVIEIGDLVYGYTSASVRYIKPASSFTWDTNLLTTQKAYKLTHMGVAWQASAALATKDVLVDASPGAQFRFIVASSKFTQGEMMAPADSGSNTLEKQTLVSVAGQGDAAIFRIAEDYQSANVTEVLVTNQASIMYDDLSDAASGDS